MTDTPINRNRRRFLGFLAGSPLLALSQSGSRLEAALQDPALIEAAGDAINVFDFEAVARQVLPPAHYGYMATGSDGDGTLRANREGFARFAIRPRRLVDVSRIDTSVELFGSRLPSPIVLAPAGGQQMLHPEGELAVARAAKTDRKSVV